MKMTNPGPVIFQYGHADVVVDLDFLVPLLTDDQMDYCLLKIQERSEQQVMDLLVKYEKDHEH